MSEFFYTDENDEPMMYTIDINKQKELNETLFQYLRESGISSPDDVTSDLDKEELAIELVEKLIEILEIEPTTEGE